MEKSVKIIKLNEVIALSKLSKTSIYERVKNKLLPPPFSMGGRSAGYYEHEVQGVIAAMAAGCSDKEIQTIVKTLLEKRKEAVNAFKASIAA